MTWCSTMRSAGTELDTVIPLFRDGDEVEYYDEDETGSPVWRPGTIVGTRYDIRPTGGGLHTVPVDAIRSAPRLPLEGIE